MSSRSGKKHPPASAAPPVASTGCSNLIVSCFPLRRRAPPPPPAAVDVIDDEQCYWKRVQQLEEEVRSLATWLAHAHVDDGNGRLSVTEPAGAERDHRESRSSNTAAIATATRRTAHCGGSGVGHAVQEMVRLDGGGYLHEMATRAGWSWERRLAVQVSHPTVPENAASASEVLDKMSAMPAAEELCKFLARMMTMKDIAGKHSPGGGETIRTTARLNSGDDFLEAVLFSAMGKLEGLVLEGLKIQMAPSATTSDHHFGAAAGDDEVGSMTMTTTAKECMVHVVLMQARDPERKYAAVGDPMIGLMEASMEQKRDGNVKVELQGMHVAGIVFGGGGGASIMWSAFLRQCKGSPRDGGGGGHGCPCSYVRNPNRVFQR